MYESTDYTHNHACDREAKASRPLMYLTSLPFFAFLAGATDEVEATTSAFSQSKLARGGVNPGLAETHVPINI